MHLRTPSALAATALFLALGATGAHAQSLAVTPLVGVYGQADSFGGLHDVANDIGAHHESTLALGLNVKIGFLRGSLAYVSGAELTEKGVENGGKIGDGNLIAAAADLMIHPFSIGPIHPYLLGGLGLKRFDYDYDADHANLFPKGSDTDGALHVGVGTDIMFGPVGLVGEVTDFISRGVGGDSAQHDAFGMVGVKIQL